MYQFGMGNDINMNMKIYINNWGNDGNNWPTVEEMY